MSNAERRYITCEFETRAAEDGSESPTIAGYAAKFNKDSQPLGFFSVFVERIAPGAFKRTIKNADIRALFNHDPSLVLGRNKAETLRLNEDKEGLRYEVDIDNRNSDAMNAYHMIDRGDVSQSSFGFEVVRDEWKYPEEKDSKELVVRTLKEVKLFDVSPVTFPAYLDTEVDVERSLRTLALASERPLDELVDAATRGELRAYLLDTPQANAPDPGNPHSGDEGNPEGRTRETPTPATIAERAERLEWLRREDIKDELKRLPRDGRAA